MALNYYLVGKRIRDIRLKRGISQATLSEMVDKSPTHISYIEGGYKSMSLGTLVDIANALKVSADELLADSLKNPITVDRAELSDILTDCTPYERRVIVDSAMAVKQSMKEYRFMIKRTPQ